MRKPVPIRKEELKLRSCKVKMIEKFSERRWKKGL